MPIGSVTPFTYTLTNESITITAADNVLRLTVLCRQGSVTFLGSASFQGIAPNQITFAPNQGVTISAPSTGVPIDGVTISAATGGDIADVVLTTQ
jgi:hypothetical protein